MATHSLGCRLLGLRLSLFSPRKGAGLGGIGVVRKKIKAKHTCCLPLHRGNNPWGGNAVEREEGEKIDGFCFLVFFPLSSLPMLRRINPAAVGMCSA